MQKHFNNIIYSFFYDFVIDKIWIWNFVSTMLIYLIKDLIFVFWQSSGYWQAGSTPLSAACWARTTTSSTTSGSCQTGGCVPTWRHWHAAGACESLPTASQPPRAPPPGRPAIRRSATSSSRTKSPPCTRASLWLVLLLYATQYNKSESYFSSMWVIYESIN